ncbi:iron ABC transporter permease [Candidatus Synechococcus calcipolaris G9]|uniref:Iron ABC transporter permease n=1 Tax=Candidatus Synechococcus calcipolaris G9 TaxID=1497997 RepID=A0ABT6EZF5_9SYNE|nr:iron ABC transporter permease [Candidatus Synechococcus calcipolaris]MDG2990994.1 iron ABC transporter permease [Candidatus Synechococcus calcipolaris G9]
MANSFQAITRRWQDWRGKAKKSPPLFLILMAAVTAIALVLPLIYLILRTASIEPVQLWEFISRPRTLTIVWNSLIMAALVTLFSGLIAIPLAFLTVQTDLPWRRFWAVVTALPLAVPTYVGSFALIAMFGPRGSLLQTWLAPLGVDQLPAIYGLTGTVAAITMFSYPYVLLTVRAGLQGMNPSMEEAARSLGHNPWSVFFRVILPQLRPSIVAGSLLVALYALQDFGTPTLMRFESFTEAIFIQYRASFNRNFAAALSLMLVLLVLVILFLEYRARTRAVYYTRGTDNRQNRRLIPLGRWRWPAIAFCATVTALCVVLPVGVILYWLLRSPQMWAALQAIIPMAVNSVWAAGLAAIFSTIFALPVAVLAVRFPSGMTTMIERGTYIGFGLPGVVVAIALVFFGANYAPWLYQTMPMLIFAYMVLFLPQSVGTLRNSLLQVSPSLEESARCLGRSPRQTLWEITIPLIRPGFIGGLVLIFLTAIKELPATILLSPIGFRTLATQIWLATNDVSFVDAAAASLAILVVCTGLTLIVLSQEQKTYR